MAPSLATIPDAYLWLGLGVFTFFAVQQVSQGLRNIVSLTEVRNANPSQNQSPSAPQRLPPNPKQQEDAIKTSSLLTLATSPNFDIQSSATKILCQRFYASKSAKKLLVKDLISKDEEVKHRAHLAFDLLSTCGALRMDLLFPPQRREGWRIHESSAPVAEDAADLRRRRREAVVIHDGDGERPIGSEDMYMRGAAGVFESDEERMLWDSISQLRESDTALQAELDELFVGREDVRGELGDHESGEEQVPYETELERRDREMDELVIAELADSLGGSMEAARRSWRGEE